MNSQYSRKTGPEKHTNRDSRAAGGAIVGLVLSVVKSIVDDHHGTIELDRSGPGARFRIVFPAYREEDGEPDRQESSSRSDAARRLEAVVLVLDDDPDFVEIASRMLSSAGCSVMASGEPADALQLVASWADEIDLVMTDQSMPGMTGVVFIARAREMGLDAPAVIVAATDPGLSEADRARLGILDVLRKPVRRSALLELVGRVAKGR